MTAYRLGDMVSLYNDAPIRARNALRFDLSYSVASRIDFLVFEPLDEPIDQFYLAVEEHAFATTET